MEPPADAPRVEASAEAGKPDPLASLVWTALAAWSLLLALGGLAYRYYGREWAWVMIAVGVASGVSTIVCRQWERALLAALFVLAFGALAAGAATGYDVYVATGLVMLTLLSVGGLVLRALGAPGPGPGPGPGGRPGDGPG